MKHTRARSKLFALGAAIVLVTSGLTANADIISHTISAGDSVMRVAVGGVDGQTTYKVSPTDPDDDLNGCNLRQQSSLVVNVVSSDTQIATVTPSQLTFTACGELATPIKVKGITAGEATISLAQVSNTTGGTFNLDLAAFTVVVNEPRDTKAPTITYTGQSPVANANGWNNTAVTLTWTCVDEEGGSGVVAENVQVTLDEQGANRSATGICVDKAGNSSEDTQDGINIDLADPVISYSGQNPPANDAGWNNSDVTSTWTCTDALSGVDEALSNLTHTARDEGAEVMTEGICVDLAGNADVDTRTVKIDKTAPTVEWNSEPVDHYFGFAPAAPTCSALDVLSGPAGCTVEGYATTVGPHTMKATAKDVAGNEGTDTKSYEVLAWTIVGFKSPVDMGGAWNSVKGGSTVPLKFEVFAGDTELTDTAVVASFRTTLVTCDAGSATAEPVNIETTGKTALRYDATEGQFIQNWQTPKNPGACYKVTATTLDGSSAVALFKLR